MGGVGPIVGVLRELPPDFDLHSIILAERSELAGRQSSQQQIDDTLACIGRKTTL